MPRQDGTGPQGQGPQTGRGMGICNPMNQNQMFQNPNYMSVIRGMGRGRGMGFGRCFRNRGFKNI